MDGPPARLLPERSFSEAGTRPHLGAAHADPVAVVPPRLLKVVGAQVQCIAAHGRVVVTDVSVEPAGAAACSRRPGAHEMKPSPAGHKRGGRRANPPISRTLAWVWSRWRMHSASGTRAIRCIASCRPVNSVSVSNSYALALQLLIQPSVWKWNVFPS